jgi:LmbE family N-acetylglucosaminyl deacetylase
MSPASPPPGATTTVEPRSALIIAPHFDDEVLGCGGLVTQFTAAGASVRVMFCSDGGGATTDAAPRRAESARRREEARLATAVLGLSGIDELALPDGALAQHVECMADGIRHALLEHRPEFVFVPSPLEVSPDHRAAFAALHRVLEALRREPAFVSDTRLRGLTVLAYEVNHPLHPNVLVDVGAQVPLIERAMGCYASQHDYLRGKLGLLKFRTLTLPPSVAAAEAYRQLSVEDFTTRSPARLIGELGGVPEFVEIKDGPLISVIVRTKDRPEFLAQALASLAHSTYRQLEVIIVNDGGCAYELPVQYPLPMTSTNLPVSQGRAGAANAGIAHARGDFVAFLDDDDLVDAEHFETLVGLVRAAGVRVAYTDAAVGVYEPAAGTGWQCVERRIPFSRDFDPERLLFENYIPFNTLLIERALVDKVGPLDIELPLLEDWDLLIRLTEHVAFHHLARVTCEYRQFPTLDHGLTERRREQQQLFAMTARIIAKHRGRITPEVTARVINRLRAEIVAEQTSVTTGARQVDILQRQVDILQRQVDVFHREILAMQATRAWRLAERWRALRDRLTGRGA